MGSDMVVVLSQGTVDGQAFLGHNSNRPAGEPQSLVRSPGQSHAPDEIIAMGQVSLPQVRKTWTVLASQAVQQLGYQNGVNERGLGIARTPLQTRLEGTTAGLTGPDLVRLLLERCGSASQAEEMAIDLVSRYGHGSGEGAASGEAFLIADAGEAFVLVVCGRYWVVQEVDGMRSLNEACCLQQNWHRLAPGLADLAIARGWWPEDGSKLDFEQAFAVAGVRDEACLRRQARASQMLLQQQGRIDLTFLRRVLADHFEDAEEGDEPTTAGVEGLCRHGENSAALTTAVSLATRLDSPPGLPRVIWWACGSPCTSVYFPIVFDGDLPAAFQHGSDTVSSVWQRMRQLLQRAATDDHERHVVRDALTGLQMQFDQDTRDFVEESGRQAARGQSFEKGRMASAFLQHNLERFEDLCRNLLLDARQPQRHRPAVRVQEQLSQGREL